MKMKFFVLIFAAVMMAACGGGSSSAEKSGCQSAGAGCCQSGGSGCGSAAGAGCCQGGAVKRCEMKKIISAQVFIKPEHVDAFLAFTKDLIELSRAEEGCISYTLYQDPNDRTTFLFFEEWKNQAAVDFHFSTEHFINFGAKLEEFASKPPVITIFDSPSERKL